MGDMDEVADMDWVADIVVGGIGGMDEGWRVTFLKRRCMYKRGR